MMSEDGDFFTGKLKGGPKKTADVKAPKAGKVPAIKAEKASKSSAPKAPKGGGKISAPQSHNYVKPKLGTKAAPNLFKGPKLKKGKR